MMNPNKNTIVERLLRKIYLIEVKTKSGWEHHSIGTLDDFTTISHTDGVYRATILGAETIKV